MSLCSIGAIGSRLRDTAQTKRPPKGGLHVVGFAAVNAHFLMIFSRRACKCLWARIAKTSVAVDFATVFIPAFSERGSPPKFPSDNSSHAARGWFIRSEEKEGLHTTKAVGLPRAREHGELYDGVA
jgi:hypothetical protein